MLTGFFQIMVFQALGEVVGKWFLPMIPGPVLGLVLLLIFMAMTKKIPQPMNDAATGILQHLGLLFVPASVGVIMYLPVLKAHWGAVLSALVLSVIATMAVTALVLKVLSQPKVRSHDEH